MRHWYLINTLVKQCDSKKDSWGASYSSPRIASMHNRKICLVFTGGESRPPTGDFFGFPIQQMEKT